MAKDGGAFARWERRSLAHFAVGAVLRVAAFIAVFSGFILVLRRLEPSVAHIPADEWPDRMAVYWQTALIAGLVWWAFLVALEALRRIRSNRTD